MTEGEFTVVPIVESYDNLKPIGELRILTSALPPTPDFAFTIAFEALAMDASYVKFTSYKLQAVTIQSDDRYLAYLQSQKGK